jgi:glycosyltransferase involved in cell wall biosynthesis
MERLAYSFYKHYKSKGYAIKALKFIKLESDIINFNEDELFLSNIDFHEMSKFQRLLFYIKLPFKLKALVKQHHITHSMAFGDPANFYSSISFTKEFKIGSIHALKSVEMSDASFLTKLTAFGLKYTYKNLNKLVCISHAIKEDLIKNCNYKHKDNLEVIYNPHDLSEIATRSLEPIDEEKEISIFKDDVILFLGRLSTQKSPWHLIKAFSEVLKQKPNTKLVIIGDGDASVMAYLNKLILQFKCVENIFFLGRKSNPYKYLKKASALVLSSHYEGTPNVIVEAIALNIPVVSSNCTNGIGELMCINPDMYTISNENVEVEAGIITPNLFKGKLGVPQSIENTVSYEEKCLANALNNVLSNSQAYTTKLLSHKDDLLSKFNLTKVASKYLKNI